MNRRDFLGMFRSLAVLPFVKLDGLTVGSDLTVGQVVYMDDDGKLGAYNGTGHIIGVATRDIQPGETIKWTIGGNSGDIVTNGYFRLPQ